MNKTALLLLAALLGAAPAPAPTTLTVVSVTGGVLTRKGRALAPKAALAPGDTVTLDAGQAVIAAGEAGHLLLKGPASFTARAAGVSLGRGSLLSSLPGLKGRGFAVATKTAVAAVRGTDFYVSVKGPRETYVCACEGRLEISGGAKDAPRPLKGTHHTARRYSRGRSGLEDGDAGMEGHTDEELAALHALNSGR